jgi:metallophosphoesterase (TIGR00282 family)
VNILFISDIVGDPGRKAVKHHLPGLRDKYSPALVIANGENAAGGFGITERIAEELIDIGIDLLTSGNHIWDKREVEDYINKEDRLLRPANLPPGVPGYGSALISARNGVKVGVINLMGRVFMLPIDCPFRKAKEEVAKLKSQGAKVILIDFHAEATSEKISLARYLDGSVTAVLGTHTHVQTADEKVLSGGTAFITDVGMTGPHDSVIGVTAELAIKRFLTQMPTRFDTAKGDGTLEAVVVAADPHTGKAAGITRISLGD